MRSVYLSKSNRANPDYVSMVRVYLEERGYEVIEHQGGEYDSSLLYQCKYMVMVGIDRPSSHGEGIVMVGKGQYNQLRERKNRGLDRNIYFSHTDEFTSPITGKPVEEPVFRSVITNGVVDEDNWTMRYGMLRCKMSSYHRMTVLASHAKRPRPEPCDTDMDKVIFKTHLACITLFK